MHNNLDKQPVKQNTPIVAIGGCGQEWTTNRIIAHFTAYVNFTLYALVSFVRLCCAQARRLCRPEPCRLCHVWQAPHQTPPFS